MKNTLEQCELHKAVQRNKLGSEKELSFSYLKCWRARENNISITYEGRRIKGSIFYICLLYVYLFLFLTKN